MTNKFFDLQFSQLESGTIRLKQEAYGDDVVDLHPVQFRYVAEHFGLVAPSYPADELSKQLAEQLCRVFLDMSDDYRHLSHTLEDTYSRLDGFIDAMPVAIFPHHLWDEREERSNAEEQKARARASDPASPTFGISSSPITPPRAIADDSSSNPNLFELMLSEGQPLITN